MVLSTSLRSTLNTHRIARKVLNTTDGVGGIRLNERVGDDDLHTTIEESRRLYETAKEPKDFWVIQGARPVDLHRAAPTEYESGVLEFFQKNLR